MRAIDENGLDEEIRCEMCKNPMHTDRGCDGNCKYDEKLYEKIIQILNKRITPLPSAQPEQQWIPVTERLPEKECFALVTVNDGAIYTDLSLFRKDGRFIEHTGDVIAWMPLPEPYRG